MLALGLCVAGISVGAGLACSARGPSDGSPVVAKFQGGEITALELRTHLERDGRARGRLAGDEREALLRELALRELVVEGIASGGLRGDPLFLAYRAQLERAWLASELSSRWTQERGEKARRAYAVRYLALGSRFFDDSPERLSRKRALLREAARGERSLEEVGRVLREEVGLRGGPRPLLLGKAELEGAIHPEVERALLRLRGVLHGAPYRFVPPSLPGAQGRPRLVVYSSPDPSAQALERLEPEAIVSRVPDVDAPAAGWLAIELAPDRIGYVRDRHLMRLAPEHGASHPIRVGVGWRTLRIEAARSVDRAGYERLVASLLAPGGMRLERARQIADRDWALALREAYVAWRDAIARERGIGPADIDTLDVQEAHGLLERAESPIGEAELRAHLAALGVLRGYEGVAARDAARDAAALRSLVWEELLAAEARERGIGWPEGSESREYEERFLAELYRVRSWYGSLEVSEQQVAEAYAARMAHSVPGRPPGAEDARRPLSALRGELVAAIAARERDRLRRAGEERLLAKHAFRTLPAESL